MKNYTAREACQLLGIDNKTFQRWLKKAEITLQPGKYDEREKQITLQQLELLAAQHERQLGEVSPQREAHPTVKALERKVAEVDAAIFHHEDQLAALERKVTDQAEQLRQLEAALRIATDQLERLATASLSELETQLHDIRAVYLSKLLEYDPALLKALTARVEALEQRLSTPATTPGTPETATKPKTPRAQPLLSASVVGTSSELPAGLVSARSFAKDHAIHENTLDKAIATGRLPVMTGKWKVGNAYVQKALDQTGRAQFVAMYRSNPHFRQCDDAACPCHEDITGGETTGGN